MGKGVGVNKIEAVGVGVKILREEAGLRRVGVGNHRLGGRVGVCIAGMAGDNWPVREENHQKAAPNSKRGSKRLSRL